MSVTASSATPELAVPAPAPAQEPQPGPVEVCFDAAPDCYRHWRLRFDGAVAWLLLDVDEQGGIVPGYELKLNSYDLGVDIELYDAVQRLRFSHPEVRSVVLTSGKDKTFCAGANIRMLAQSSHPWKVNFCKFTNETRNGIEDATENSGQTYIAAINGTAAGGGYELALACDEIVLANDGSSAVALPELPLLGVLPAAGGPRRRPAAAGAHSHALRHPLPTRRGRLRPARRHRDDHRLWPARRRTGVVGAHPRTRCRLLAAGDDARARRPHPAAAGQRARARQLGDQDQGRDRRRAGLRACLL